MTGANGKIFAQEKSYGRVPDSSFPGIGHRGKSLLAALLLVAVLAKPLFPLVRSNLMSLSLSSARHKRIKFLRWNRNRI